MGSKVTTVGRVPLTRERVVAEALEQIDELGPEALTMRRLGARLGVEAMSLYNHVASKEDLLDGVASLLLELVEVPDPPAGDWRVQLRAIAAGVRHIGLTHPRAFPLVASRRLDTLGSWAPVLAGFTEARRAGLPTGASVHVVHTFAGFIVGTVLLEIGTLEARASVTASVELPEQDAQLREYLGACADVSDDEQFTAGLDLLIAGMEHLLARPGPA